MKKCTGSQFCECRECEAVKHGRRGTGATTKMMESIVAEAAAGFKGRVLIVVPCGSQDYMRDLLRRLLYAAGFNTIRVGNSLHCHDLSATFDMCYPTWSSVDFKLWGHRHQRVHIDHAAEPDARTNDILGRWYRPELGQVVRFWTR
jgi:hypothetical protein